jgi:hypothetical protein
LTTRFFTSTIQPLRIRLSSAVHPNLYFWTGFLLLNFLLFLPAYLLNRETSAFLPPIFERAAEPSVTVRKLFSWRNNLDIFRLNIEITLLLAIWAFLPWLRRPRLRGFYRLLFTSVTIVGLAYAIYENLIVSIYQEDPVFYAHFQLAVDGLDFVWKHLTVSSLTLGAAILAIAATIALLALWARILIGGIPVNHLNRGTRILLAFLACLSILAALNSGKTLSSPKSIASSLVAKLGKNTADSIALYQRVRAVDDLPFYQAYNYTGHDLLGKPNIYLIFIESYGSTLYSQERFTDSYTKLLGDLTTELENGGWYAATALSESPTWGGGSWMAYTTALFGMRVDSHPQYLALQERFQEESYPDLGSYMQSQGYRYLRATSLAVELDDEEWHQYKDFFGVDSWIRYSDLDYQGMHYGWGPSPPDQYVLHAIDQDIKGESDQPFLLFWITQNSHYPWRKVPKVVDDWRAMNDGNAVVTVFKDESTSLIEKRENYLEAIIYELSFLKAFILNEAGDNDIFVLIGDHQPGYITRRSDGFDTPLHIISKDRAFVRSFAEYGFDPGLKVQDPLPAMRHEGFYSLFIRVLLQQYGQGGSKLPEYLPHGIQLENH